MARFPLGSPEEKVTRSADPAQARALRSAPPDPAEGLKKGYRSVQGKTQSISILEPDFVKLTGIFYKTVSPHWETPSSQPHQ